MTWLLVLGAVLAVAAIAVLWSTWSGHVPGARAGDDGWWRWIGWDGDGGGGDSGGGCGGGD